MKESSYSTPNLILDEMLLDSMSDAKLLDFATTNYQRNLAGTGDYPTYYFDVDDANILYHQTQPDGKEVQLPGYLMVRIEAADKAFKFTRKVRYKPEADRLEHFTYDHQLLAARTDVFSYLYPHINKDIMERGTVIPSRNGTTREFLNFKTIIEDPTRRCVGGFNRNSNIFFLLAEALWIQQGREDVGFLTIFNKQMAEFSDNGKTFHAPYGHRIRNARCQPNPSGGAITQDQLACAIDMLRTNPEDRRVVISIWDNERDLMKITKDIPCNDMLMFKIRGGKLYQTVQNRSNDLHWGLPTNVFQFSFLGEIMANCLGVGLGQQVHNSQSLHIYVDNPIAGEMYAKYSNMDYHNLYDVCTGIYPMDFDWKITAAGNDPLDRLDYLDNVISKVLNLVENVAQGTFKGSIIDSLAVVRVFSSYLAYVAELLIVYVDYSNSKRDDHARTTAIRNIVALRADGLYHGYNTDIEFLAINFFVARLKVDHDIKTVNGNYGAL